ncbi:uncharacterized protein DUF3298 [Arcticibacter tournemirensis]|uniref:DUF3298 and DUF4163 domain-containing protein n=1 Tax=Arcticibacter tournemirensis TaxID=699437 RepID=A0A5M9HC18_9SPHI|nr:DUF3298 and DUF4163 domain-containing protein [Arcticibacter tournemirensis]KAA8482854.1 DUF3298 and DUF4163 domain-containing protein [Arcticibacter tournemirensis]TQM49769.1 uncharacterized protein DUF3298 [Arcticibacter tournemirensis]
MMMLRDSMKIFNSLIYPLSIVLALLSACNNTPQNKLKSSKSPGLDFDTVTYTLKTITKDDPECDTSREKNCRIVNIKYHVFDNHPVLNDSIRTMLLAIYPFERTDPSVMPSLDKQTEEFMDKYEEFKKEPYSQGRKYGLISSTKVMEELGNLLTLQLDAYTYSGGAHGASFTHFFNYDIRNKKMIFIDDVINDNYQDCLVKVAERIFKKNEGLNPGQPLKPNAYFFENNRFSLANNYVFTPQGIMFLYNEYEIKPYADGKTELLVPYAEIKHMLKTETLIRQFLK